MRAREGLTATERLIRWLDRVGAPLSLGLCLLAAAVLWAAKPVAHGHAYQLGFRVTLIVSGVWFVYRYGGEWLSLTRFALPVGAGVGLYLAINRFRRLDPDAEIIHVYSSVFATLEAGLNPYTCGCIFHRAEHSVVKMGNFNYPPLEIAPYWAVHKLVGSWNSLVLVSTLLALQALCCWILRKTFPRIPLAWMLPLFPVFLFFELFTNVAFTFVCVAAVVWAVVRLPERDNTPGGALVLAALFAVSLQTKFIAIPLVAAYYWHQVRPRQWRSYVPVLAKASLTLVLTALLMAPFGIWNVFENTILFNLVLERRGELTTYFPNVLSGLFSWAGAEIIYPPSSVLVLAGAILIAPWLRLFSALLLAITTFLMVSPTPEPQYVPVVVYLAAAGYFHHLESERPPPGPQPFEKLPSRRKAARYAAPQP